VLGGQCFFRCSSLLTIKFESDAKLRRVERAAFGRCSPNLSIYIPWSIQSAFREFRQCLKRVD
jgi:hypothetical protein